MANTKIYADGGAITVWWELPNFAANPKNPTAEEINAGIDITRVISWNDFSFNAEASDQTSDPAVGDVGNVQTRSFANYGGTISFYYPRDLFRLLHKDKANGSMLTPKEIWRQLRAGVAEEFIRKLPDEFHDEANRIKNNLQDEYDTFSFWINLQWQSDYHNYNTKKDLAFALNTDPSVDKTIRAAMFLIYENRSIEDLVWKAIEPKGS